MAGRASGLTAVSNVAGTACTYCAIQPPSIRRE